MNGTGIWRVPLAATGLAVFAVSGCGFSLNITDGPDPGTGGGALEFATGTLPVGDQGADYRATLEATGGVAPYTFARSRGDD
ncbi:MAG: hypothetical protein IH988_06715 [Planctomycetes bacterium]|nr:hypothetical protein [Planctomycetota bacterium]